MLDIWFHGKIKIEGSVDEFLYDSATKLERNAYSMERDVLTTFAEISNSNTRVFMDKMSDWIRIYNHTEEICFDKEKIYLVAGE